MRRVNKMLDEAKNNFANKGIKDRNFVEKLRGYYNHLRDAERAMTKKALEKELEDMKSRTISDFKV